MEKILIGINGSMLDEQPTGVGVYSYNLINSLHSLYQNECKNEIVVFSPTTKNLAESISIKKLSNLLQSSRYGKLAAFCRFLWNTFSYPIQARKFNLLLSPTTHGSLFSKNQIITIHDLLSLRFGNISWHQKIYFKYILPFIVSKAKLIIAVSETTKTEVSHFLKCPESKIKVIYNGFDHTRYFNDGMIKKTIFDQYGVQNYFLAVGPTYPHKNFEFLIEAFNELDESIKSSHPLVIAGGKQPYLNNMKRLVADLKLEDYVKMLGYVPLELMPSLYRESFALIFPSLYEGFGFPLVEAMACGCPVIAANTSSIPEVCENAALYFDPNSKSSLLDCIYRISKSDMLRKEFIDKGFVQSKKFSWKSTAEKFKVIIDKQFQEN